MTNSKTKKITVTAVMAAMATVLMFLEMPLPLFPFFLKLDVSDLPAVICAFAIGPGWGAAVELLKNLIHMLSTQTGFAGEAANFVVGACFVIPAGLIYRKKHTKKGALAGLAAGTLCMAAAGIAANFLIILPIYSQLMPIDAIVRKTAEVNSLITDKTSLVLYGITPFNLIKGVIISAVTLLIYKPVSAILHR
ncbi:MAG: ECF transporter S component [Clostridiales bacterium]|jgi:riboflavin transporter FmnP|nr:ECF transporter S component [Clostridiales bacterium]